MPETSIFCSLSGFLPFDAKVFGCRSDFKSVSFCVNNVVLISKVLLVGFQVVLLSCCPLCVVDVVLELSCMLWLVL